MPCIRGIEVFLSTKPDGKPIPEYPHPDSSSARVLGNSDRRRVSPSISDQLSKVSTGNQDIRHEKYNPTASVYIPSVPGFAFGINYRINQSPPAPCKYMFFKLYINGRQMLCWGIESAVRAQGKAVKSIWAPSQLDDQVGFEERNFVFLAGQENKSAAEDGGLIEVQVFRAKARKARAPKLEKYRYPENYGIAVPSIGLSDRPENASRAFFDYHLIDPKDLPYATFKLHYRSLKSLEQLNLIPHTNPETNHLIDSSCPSGYTVPCNADTSDEAVFEGSGQPCIDSDADDHHDHGDAYFLKSPPELPPPLPSTANIPQPIKAARDGFRESYLQRPLPDIPDKPIRRRRQVSTASSAGSSTPSITPSLMSCVHDGSFDEDFVELGLARVVNIVPFKSDVRGEEEEGDGDSHIQQLANSSFSDYDISLPSTSDSNSAYILSPKSYLPTTGSSFEFGLERFSSPHSRRESRSSLVGGDMNQALPSRVFPNFSRPDRMPNPYSGDISESVGRADENFQPGASGAISTPDAKSGMGRLSSSPGKMPTLRHMLQVNAASPGNQSDSDRKTNHRTGKVAVRVTPGFGFGLGEKQDGESGNWI